MRADPTHDEEVAERAGRPSLDEGASQRRRRDGLPDWTRAWAGDSLILLVGHVVATAATAATAVLIVRELAPGDWAAFSAFLGLALAFAIFVDFGMATWLLREFSQITAEHPSGDSSTTGQLLGVAVAFDVGMTAALLLVPAVIALLIGTSVTNILALACLVLYVGIGAVAAGFEARLRSLRRVSRVTAAMVAEKGVLVVLVTMVIVLGNPTVLALAAVYPVAAAVRLTVIVRAALVGIVLLSPAFRDVRRVVGASIPFALSSLGLNVLPRLDALLLLGLSSTSAAYLALGDRILGTALILPVVLSVTLYPFVAKQGRVGWKLVLAVGALGAGIAAAGILATPAVVPAVFGEKYAAAVGPIQVVLLALPFIYASNVLLTYVYSAGRERAVLVGTLTVSLLGTCAILLGQTIGGPKLAAAGTVTRQVLFLVVLIAIARGLIGASGDDATKSTRTLQATR